MHSTCLRLPILAVPVAVGSLMPILAVRSQEGTIAAEEAEFVDLDDHHLEDWSTATAHTAEVAAHSTMKLTTTIGGGDSHPPLAAKQTIAGGAAVDHTESTAVDHQNASEVHRHPNMNPCWAQTNLKGLLRGGEVAEEVENRRSSLPSSEQSGVVADIHHTAYRVGHLLVSHQKGEEDLQHHHLPAAGRIADHCASHPASFCGHGLLPKKGRCQNDHETSRDDTIHYDHAEARCDGTLVHHDFDLAWYCEAASLVFKSAEIDEKGRSLK